MFTPVAHHDLVTSLNISEDLNWECAYSGIFAWGGGANMQDACNLEFELSPRIIRDLAGVKMWTQSGNRRLLEKKAIIRRKSPGMFSGGVCLAIVASHYDPLIAKLYPDKRCRAPHLQPPLSKRDGGGCKIARLRILRKLPRNCNERTFN